MAAASAYMQSIKMILGKMNADVYLQLFVLETMTMSINVRRRSPNSESSRGHHTSAVVLAKVKSSNLVGGKSVMCDMFA